MTKISNQYSLTNILTADLANSRLGINNVSPTVALDVTGAGKFSSTVTSVGNGTTSALYSNNNGSGAQYYQDFGTGAGFVAGRILRGNGASGFAANGLNIVSYDSLQLSANATGGSGGSINLLGGNVGIGIDVPTGNANRILHINGADSAELHLTRSNSGTTSILGGYLNFDGSNNLNLQNRSSGTINFITGTTERMRITSAGNVAINNTTGTVYSKLSVAGAISFNNNTNSAVSGGEYGNAYAKTISVIAGGSAVSIKPGLGPESSLILVSGRSTTGNRFSDLILVIGQGTTAPTVIASRTYLSPATRTYSNGGESLVLQLTGSSETYTIFLTGIGGNESS